MPKRVSKTRFGEVIKTIAPTHATLMIAKSKLIFMTLFVKLLFNRDMLRISFSIENIKAAYRGSHVYSSVLVDCLEGLPSYQLFSVVISLRNDYVLVLKKCGFL